MMSGDDRRRLRIGSRTSPMALAQAVTVQGLLGSAGTPRPEIAGFETSGDRWHGDLADLNGKGAFLKEIDAALLRGDVDMAVHCMKDVPGDVPAPEGLVFAAYLPREDVRDCVVFPAGSPYSSLAGLPPGAQVGTSSARRRAQLGRGYPDLVPQRFRGNVTSRLARLDDGEFDAAVLARAGLLRLGLAGRISEVLPTNRMVPAIGAGVIGIRVRAADRALREALRPLDDAAARTAVTAERAMLRSLRGDCSSPIAGHCRIGPDGWLSLLGMVLDPDGGRAIVASRSGPAGMPAELGTSVADDLLRQGARELIAGTSPVG